MELAVAHGYGRATIKGHDRQRQNWWRKVLPDMAPKNTGKPNIAGWTELAAKFGELGWSVQHGGERNVH